VTGPTGARGATGVTGPIGVRGGSEVNVVFNSNSGTPGLAFSNTSFTPVSNFYFAGTTSYGASPTQFTIVISSNSAGGAATAAIVDLGTGLTVATISATGVPTTPASFSTNTFNNVSAAATIWQVQFIGKAGSNNNSTFYSFYVRLT
jgi:hypothetical protein